MRIIPIGQTTALKTQKAEVEAILASVVELLLVLILGGKNRLINFILSIALNFHISNSGYLFVPINSTYRYI